MIKPLVLELHLTPAPATTSNVIHTGSAFKPIACRTIHLSWNVSDELKKQKPVWQKQTNRERERENSSRYLSDLMCKTFRGRILKRT